jgi:hypothetical protein
MAEEVKGAAPAETPKITLLFLQPHEHRTGTFDKEGKELVKTYRPGDRDKFTQTDADTIRALRVAQTVANP